MNRTLLKSGLFFTVLGLTMPIHATVRRDSSQQVKPNIRPNIIFILTDDPYSGVPSELTVEYIREPKNASINNKLPVYSWIVPREAVSQNAYQILVASSKSNIDNNLGDVWNSGQVRSKASTNIEQTGKPLNPDSKYLWKVRIWDQDNRLSDYSLTQEFKLP